MTTRLTPGGVVLALLAAAAAAGGALTGYAELWVVAVLAAVVLAAALVIPQVGSPIHLARVDVPRLVTRGARFTVGLRAAAEGHVPAVRILDQFSGARVAIDLPALRPGATLDLSYGVRATRRGAQPVGPILEERSDPFGLVVRTIEHAVHDEVVVHPVVHRIRIASPSDRERQRANMLPRISDDPLAEFRALREYQPGDDPRTVHWATSARLGSLVVKDFLQLRRARRAVVVETLDSTISEAAFEEAVDIAASLAADALEQSIVLTVQTRDAAAAGTDKPLAGKAPVLDLLARVQRSTPAGTLDAGLLRPRAEVPDQLFLVLGSTSPLLGVYAANPWTRQALVVIRVSGPRLAQLPRLPFPTVDVRTAREFAATARR